VNKGTGKVRTVTRPDGTTLKLLPKATDTSADIQTMEYLIAGGAAKNVNEAANRLREMRGNGVEKTSLGLYKDFYKANIEAGQEAEEAEANAKRQTEEAIKIYGGNGDIDDGSTSSTRRSDPAKGDSATNVPPPEERTIGKVYMNSKGEMARWTAQGWAAVGSGRKPARMVKENVGK
jgi:hypothetical protein